SGCGESASSRTSRPPASTSPSTACGAIRSSTSQSRVATAPRRTATCSGTATRTRLLPSPRLLDQRWRGILTCVQRRLESLKVSLVTVIGLAGTADFLRQHHSPSRILGYAAGIAVLLLVASLPRLRGDERGFSFVRSVLGVSILAGVLLATMLVVHSWRWILLAGVLVAVYLLD